MNFQNADRSASYSSMLRIAAPDDSAFQASSGTTRFTRHCLRQTPLSSSAYKALLTIILATIHKIVILLKNLHIWLATGDAYGYDHANAMESCPTHGLEK